MGAGQGSDNYGVCQQGWRKKAGGHGEAGAPSRTEGGVIRGQKKGSRGQALPNSRGKEGHAWFGNFPHQVHTRSTPGSPPPPHRCAPSPRSTLSLNTYPPIFPCTRRPNHWPAPPHLATLAPYYPSTPAYLTTLAAQTTGLHPLTLPQASDCRVIRSSLSAMPLRFWISLRVSESVPLNNMSTTAWNKLTLNSFTPLRGGG